MITLPIPVDQRKDKREAYQVRTLFWEWRNPEYTPIFTLKDEDIERDGVQYLSLKKLYLQYDDPTEYSFAMGVFGTWKHWQAVAKSPVVLPYLEEWRIELEIKLKSKAIRAMINTATQEGSKGTTAARYVAEKGWEKQRGRPSKAEVEKERKVQAGVSSEISEDAKRLGIH